MQAQNAGLQNADAPHARSNFRSELHITAGTIPAQPMVAMNSTTLVSDCMRCTFLRISAADGSPVKRMLKVLFRPGPSMTSAPCALRKVIISDDVANGAKRILACG